MPLAADLELEPFLNRLENLRQAACRAFNALALERSISTFWTGIKIIVPWRQAVTGGGDSFAPAALWAAIAHRGWGNGHGL